MARPTKLTKDRSKAICDRLRKGDPLKVAAEASGITFSTLNAWRIKGDADEEGEFRDFAEDVNQALAECQSNYITVLAKHSAGYEKVVTKSRTHTVFRVIKEYADDGSGRVIREIKEPVQVTDLEITKSNESDWRAAAELLKHRFSSEGWSEKQQLEHSGPDGRAIEITSPDMQAAAQELKEWRQQMTDLLSNISSAPPTRPTSPTATA